MVKGARNRNRILKVKGARNRDRILLLYSLLAYLAKRIMMRIIMGKKRRDAWFKANNYLWYTPIKGKILLTKVQPTLKFWTRVGIFLPHDGYEPNVRKIFKPNVGDVVIDAGANVGLYSILAGTLVGKSGKIIAVEPSTETFNFLCKNIKEQDLEKIVIPVKLAVSDAIGKARLYFLDSESGRNSIAFAFTDTWTEVETITIDSLAAQMNLKKVDWIKMDIEGAEYNALLGAIQTLQRNDVRLIIEILKVNAEKVFNLLTDLGYEATILDSHDYELYSGTGWYDVFASKRKKDSRLGVISHTETQAQQQSNA